MWAFILVWMVHHFVCLYLVVLSNYGIERECVGMKQIINQGGSFNHNEQQQLEINNIWISLALVSNKNKME